MPPPHLGPGKNVTSPKKRKVISLLGKNEVAFSATIVQLTLGGIM